MTAFFIFGLGALLGVWIGYMAAQIERLVASVERRRGIEPETEAEPVEASTIEAEEDEPEAFVVAGKPRKPNWRQRERQLRAAARTGRKKLEEWRD